jgi:Uncharacterized protein involved in tellurite resistance
MNGMNRDRNNVVETVEAEIVQPGLNMEKFDMVEYQNNTKVALRKSPEVVALTNKIDAEDFNSVLIFGKEASEGISKVSDGLLSSMKAVKAEESGQMIVQLTKIMDKFDIDEFQNVKEPGFLEKMFNKAKTSIESMFQKYDTMGIEVQKVYQIIKGFEQDIYQSNKQLEQMFKANLDYYDELEKYICAGEIALEELDRDILPKYKAQADIGDQRDIVNYQQLLQIRDMLDQKIYDLRLTENVAMQTVPMINAMQLSNYNLLRKINSAFIVTLPVFKQCLAQAVILKRQELQAKSMKALDDKTNELLIKNAQNVAKQTTENARLAGKSSIDIKTLETTWNTIMTGLQETSRIQEENQKERLDGVKTLENMKINIQNQQKQLK